MIKVVSSELFKGLEHSDMLSFVRWELTGLESVNLNFLSKRESLLNSEVKISQFKYFKVFDLGCFLGNEEIRVEILFGSKPIIYVCKEDIPEYILEDEILLSGVIDEIVSDFLNGTNSEKSVSNLITNEISSVTFLKDFPKSLKKEYIYRYLPVLDYNCQLFLTKSGKEGDLAYSWDPFDIYAKISIWGNTYLLHRFKLESSYHRFWVYNYNKERVSESDMKSINQLISYKVWEM